jgi:FlaG/FlaF family flagellin (archaellin)
MQRTTTSFDLGAVTFDTAHARRAPVNTQHLGAKSAGCDVWYLGTPHTLAAQRHGDRDPPPRQPHPEPMTPMTARTLMTALCTVYLATIAAACSDRSPGAADAQAPSFETQSADVLTVGGDSAVADANASDAAPSTAEVDATGPDAGGCVPACDDAVCGDDGCGATCGECNAGFMCDESGQCVCAPSCDGKLCGDDGCGDTCGTCLEGTTCDDAGHCTCVPDCAEQACGSDGCGGSCGECTDVQICSGAGSCVPDPEAGCAGLGLAESWSGTFVGTHATSILGFPADDGDTTGDLSFELQCLPSKVLLTGQIVGLASGKNPFELTLMGTYNTETGVMDGTIPDGSLSLEDLTIEITLAGELPGSLQLDGTLAGTYSVAAIAATSIFGSIDMNDVDATSEGTWTASPAP